MTNFDTLCEKLEGLSFEEKKALIDVYTSKLVPVLAEISQDEQSGIEIYTHFVLCAVAADGKLAEEEFQLLKPMFDAMLEKDSTYEEAAVVFKVSGLDKPEQYKKTVDLMVDLFGLLSEELKYDLVNVCLLVCAIDGEVSADEKEWILNLVDDNFGLTVMEQMDVMLSEAGAFVLATDDNGKPRMRVIGFKALVDDKIYFTVGTFKDVYKQLQKNPNCEILASLGMKFIRWDGKAVFKEDPRFMEAARAVMPQVVAMYEANGAKLAFFTLEGGSAEVVGIDGSKEKLF